MENSLTNSSRNEPGQDLSGITALQESLAAFREEFQTLIISLREDDLTYSNRVRQELDNVIAMLRFEDQNNNLDISGKLAHETQQQIDKAAVELFDELMQTRLALTRNRFLDLQKTASPVQFPKIHLNTFEEYLEKFKNLHPHLYDVWASINLDKNVKEFKDNPNRSCAVAARPNARLFRGFVAPYLRGNVLDVGCGPYSIPHYLKNYPVNFIAGIDPIDPFEAHPFEFVRGFAEFLPWEDSTFDVVIAATSLDHVISLDLALQEIRRVLKPEGVFVVWDWFTDEAQPYKPEDKSTHLIDQFHLFHFNEEWFEELMDEHYSIEEKVCLKGTYSSDRFYTLQLISK